MMVLHKLKDLIPESKFKDFLRFVYWRLKNRDTSYRLTENEKCYEIIFLNGSLKGTSLFFPIEDNKKYARECLFEASKAPFGYLKIDILQEGDYLIDAGAWPGDFTLLASRLVGEQGKVFSFEPDPRNRRYLEKVLKTNVHFQNIEIIDSAIYNSETELPFRIAKSGSRICENPYFNNGSGNYTKVRTTTIDAFVKENNISDKLKLIKMDIEGTELKAIDGARETIEKHHPALVIASYHIVDGQPSNIELEKILRNQGYDEVITFREPHQTTYAIKQ